MSVHGEYDPDCCLITPLIAINEIKCSNENCDAEHGCCLVFGVVLLESDFPFFHRRRPLNE